MPGTFGFHEVWHIFVLLGALAHFVAVMGVIV
jgi:predicted membrane channel-forming protein YqfA (hemolysin III family)